MRALHEYRIEINNTNSQLYPLQVVAAGQVVKAGISDKGAVVQLQHHKVLTSAGGQAQVPGDMNDRMNVP